MSLNLHADIDPSRNGDLLAARAEFLRHGKVPDWVRPVVYASWQRCVAADVDPSRPRPQTFDGHRLAELRAREKQLLQAAAPYLTQIHQALGDQPHLIALADRDGNILRILQSETGLPEESDLAAADLFEGACWSERDIGCNGIGTCLALGEPVALLGAEHYVESYVGWTCIGIPIRRAGQVVAALDLSVPNEYVHAHTWGWALSMATAIEHRLADGAVVIPTQSGAAALERPLQGVRGVFQLLATQLAAAPAHSRLLAQAMAELDEAERLVRSSILTMRSACVASPSPGWSAFCSGNWLAASLMPTTSSWPWLATRCAISRAVNSTGNA